VRRTPLVAVVLLSGCGLLERPEPAPPAAPAAVQPSLPPIIQSASLADTLVAYLGHLRGLSETALIAEAARQRKEGSDAGRVRAALALTLSPQADEAEIISIVEPATRKEAAPDVRAMAGFLQALATERRRLKESAAVAGTQLRDQRKALETQKQRADALQQKLDALTELEKSLSDRQPAAR